MFKLQLEKEIKFNKKAYSINIKESDEYRTTLYEKIAERLEEEMVALTKELPGIWTFEIKDTMVLFFQSSEEAGGKVTHKAPFTAGGLVLDKRY